MRPPQFAGESRLAGRQGLANAIASMRPPQFAGESLEFRERIEFLRRLQ